MTATHTSLPELQTAIYAKLVPGGTLYSGLASLGVVGVFDAGGVPENTAFPYITLFAAAREGPDNVFGTRGYDAVPPLDIWSIYQGFSECYSILNVLNNLIDQQPLTLSTHKHVYTLYQTARQLYDPHDERIRRLNVSYSTFTQES